METTLMSVDEFLTCWEQLNTSDELRLFLEQHPEFITDEVVQRMKARTLALSYSDVPHAATLAESILHAAELSRQPLHRVWALIAVGNLANRQGQPHEAIRRYDEAQQIALKVGNELEAARSQIGKVRALNILSQFELAVQVGENAWSLLQSNNEFEALGNLALNIGGCHDFLCHYEYALDVYQRGLQALSELPPPGNPALAAMLNYHIGLVFANQNRFQEALEKVAEAAEIQRQLGNTVALAVCQHSIGTYNVRLGHFNKALRLLDEARTIFTTEAMLNYITTCDIHSVSCYLALNRFEQAVQRCQITIEQLQAEERDFTFDSGLIHQYLGVALAHLGRHEEALATFEKARQLFLNTGSKMLVANPALEQAEIHYRRGEYQETEILCIQAAQIYEEQGLAVDAARCKALLGQVRLAQGHFEEAVVLATQALIAGQIAQTPLVVYQALLLQAEIAEQQGHLAQALEYYRQSLAAVEEMRGRVAAEARAAFVEDKEAAYQGAVVLSLETGDWGEALKLVERGKSRGLVDLLAGDLDVRIRVRAESDRALVNELEQLRAKRNQLVSRLANRSNPLAALNPVRGTALLEAPPESELAELQAQVKECEKQMSALVERLQIRNAAYAEDVILQPPPAEIATECLEEDAVLVEYYICREEVLAFVVERSRVTVARRLATGREVSRQLSLLRLNLANVTHILGEDLTEAQKIERINATGNNARALLQKLYKQLIGPLASQLEGYRRLVIVPHGPLHYLPFHAFYNPASGRYLLEEWAEISYLPSGSLLHFCHQRGQRPSRERGQGALVMGYSNGQLSYCLEEARSVNELLGGATDKALNECRLYLEEEADCNHFEAEAGDKRLIHLATHGQFRQDDPLFSSLLLAGGELTAQDLFNQQLKASLVTFSACETGLGTIGGGDEVLGLSRACLYAGASSLVLSLWRVEDESVSHLMKAFYARLLQGERKGVALREAQLELLQTGNYRHPFFWGPFILIGHAGLL